MVQGGVSQCGDIDLPAIFIRLEDPEILNFIETILEANSPSQEDNTSPKEEGEFLTFESIGFYLSL